MPSLIELSKGPSVLSPHYLSTMQEEPFPPAKGDAPPQFGGVDARPTSFKFSLKCPRHGEAASLLHVDSNDVAYLEYRHGTFHEKLDGLEVEIHGVKSPARSRQG